LQITRLRVSGFKSFGEPVELLIEPGLTGVVGPNGCGKSNLVEALRWVMGETSARGLRGDEMDDVIFSGSAGRAAFDLAEVTLRLRGPIEGTASLAPTSADEIDVGRRLSRGAGSLYRLNGAEARARDVQLLFADAGSGTRSASIIGQGQIGFIVDARPQERRRLLEEAAGIGGLHGRRREAELRLEATEANLARVADRLLDLERRLGELTKQSREAERYRKLGEELRRTEALFLLGRWLSARQAFGHASATAAAAAQAAQDAERELMRLRQARAQRGRELEVVADGAAKLSAELARASERLAARRREHDQAVATRAELQRRHDEAAADLERERGAAEALHDRREALQAEAAEAAALEHHQDAVLGQLVEDENAAGTVLASAERAYRTAMAGEAEAEAAKRAAITEQQRCAERQQQLARSRAGLEQEVAAAACEPAEPEADPTTSVSDALQAAEAEAEHLTQQREALLPQLARAEAAAGDARDALVSAQRRRHETETAARSAEQRRAALLREAARLEQETRSLAERRQRHHDAVSACAPARARSDLQEAQVRVSAAATAVEAIPIAERQLAETDAAAVLAAARERLARLTAEDTALRSVLAETPAAADAVVSQVRVDEGLAEALAAVLGRDLLAGLSADAACHWRMLAASDDPALPEGCVALGRHVEAPAPLRRRLAQIGLVEAAEAPDLHHRLRPGQELVTADGSVWRWDGLVRSSDGQDATAARLRQERRLTELQEQLRLAQGEVDAAAREHAAAAEALADAHVRLAAAKAHAGEASTALARAEHALAAAEADWARLSQEADELRAAEQRVRLAADALAAEQAAVPGADAATVAAVVTEVRQAEAACGAANGKLEGLRSALAQAERGLASARQRAHASRQRLDAERAAQDRRRAQEQARAQAEAEQQAVRRAALASLETELASLDEEAVRVERAAALAAERLAGMREARQAAEAAAERSRADNARLRQELERARGELAATKARRQQLAATLSDVDQRLSPLAARVEELSARAERAAAELAALPLADPELDEAGRRLADTCAQLERQAEQASAERSRLEKEIAALESALHLAEETRHRASAAIAVAEADRGRAESALESAAHLAAERLGADPARVSEDPEIAHALAAQTAEQLEGRLQRLQAQRDRIGPVNLRAELEQAEVEALLTTTRNEEAELRAAIERLRRAISTLNREGRERLTAVFTEVDEHFRRLFVRLFGGGRAHLRLTDTEDPFAAGLELEASPPGKKLTSVMLLSGGEKTLTALALVFALFLARPSPLCVLDEVDAPLDDANVDRFVTLMEEIANEAGTRFIAVTHHPLTMSRMDRLYGVTMIERGVSRLVSVALQDAMELRATG
jgi:chromosome segregation protein